MNQPTILLFVLLAFGLNAQQLHIEKGGLLEHAPFFNPDFIASKSIRSIESSYAYKDEYRPIKSTRIKRTYRFNRKGYLTRFVELRDLGYRLDSTTLELVYNQEKQVVQKNICDEYGCYFYQYWYNASGDVSKVCYGRPKPYQQPPEVQEVHYKRYGNQVKAVWENQEGRSVKEESRIFSGMNRIQSIISRTFPGRKRKEEHFEYDSTGVLKCYILEQPDKKEKVRYEYVFDAEGDVQKEVVFRNNRKIERKEFLYRDGLIYAHLEKDEQTGRIKIWEYEYAYY